MELVMKAHCLLVSLFVGCAMQTHIVSEPVLSQSTFAPTIEASTVEVKPTISIEPTVFIENVLHANPMEGPYSSIEDYCEWLFRTSERFNPVSNDNNCSYSSLKAGKGASQHAQLVYASFEAPESGSMGGEYHIALQTKDGWFVSDEQFIEDISEDGVDGFFASKLSSKKLTIEDLIPGGEAEVVLRAKKVSRFCEDCETPIESKEAQSWANQEQMVVCSVSGEQPSCVGLTSPRDEEGKATKLSFSFSASGALQVNKEAVFFSAYRELRVNGQYQIVF
jgi:hypothetical protein